MPGRASLARERWDSATIARFNTLGPREYFWVGFHLPEKAAGRQGSQRSVHGAALQAQPPRQIRDPQLRGIDAEGIEYPDSPIDGLDRRGGSRLRQPVPPGGIVSLCGQNQYSSAGGAGQYFIVALIFPG